MVRQKSMLTYAGQVRFSGFGTKIRFLLKVIPRHPLRYFGDPDSSNQSNVVEFQKSMKPTEQFASFSNQNEAKKESNKTRKRNLNKRRKDKLKRIKKAQDRYHFQLKSGRFNIVIELGSSGLNVVILSVKIFYILSKKSNHFNLVIIRGNIHTQNVWYSKKVLKEVIFHLVYIQKLMYTY